MKPKGPAQHADIGNLSKPELYKNRAVYAGSPHHKNEALQAHAPVLIFNTFTFRYKHMARNTSVTLGDHFEAFINSKIEQGRFQSVSEAVRAGLRKLEQDEARLDLLRARLKAGEDSPVAENFDSREFLEKLRKKHHE